jgi:hypothetical protein
MICEKIQRVKKNDQSLNWLKELKELPVMFDLHRYDKAMRAQLHEYANVLLDKWESARIV